MANQFKISEEEKNRILGLHESYKTTKGGLIIEQETAVVAVDNKNSNYATERDELVDLGYEEQETADDMDDVESMKIDAEGDNLDFEWRYGESGEIITFARVKGKTADWDKTKGSADDKNTTTKKVNNVRDNKAIDGAKRDFENYFRNKISGQQINIYSNKKSRDNQNQKGGVFTKGLIDSVTFAGASKNNPGQIKNRKGQLVGMKLGLTDNKGYIQYKCSNNPDKLEKSVQYVKADGKKGGFGKEFIGPKEFVNVAMKTLCGKLSVYNTEMSKVPTTSKF